MEKLGWNKKTLILLYVVVLQDVLNDIDGVQKIGMSGVLVKTGM